MGKFMGVLFFYSSEFMGVLFFRYSSVLFFPLFFLYGFSDITGGHTTGLTSSSS